MKKKAFGMINEHFNIAFYNNFLTAQFEISKLGAVGVAHYWSTRRGKVELTSCHHG